MLRFSVNSPSRQGSILIAWGIVLSGWGEYRVPLGPDEPSIWGHIPHPIVLPTCYVDHKLFASLRLKDDVVSCKRKLFANSS